MPNYIINVKEKGAKKASKNISGLNKSLGGLASKAALAAGSFLGAGMLVAGLKRAITLTGEQELAEKKLSVAFRGNTQNLKNYATALQKQTRFGDEVIMGVMTSISAFEKNEDAVMSLTAATLDLAEGTGMDLKAAGDLVAKSVGSSTNALSRYGIQVEGAVGSSERLESLTTNVATLFAGQASGSADTMTGKLTQMDNALGDLGENFGSLLAPAVTSASNQILPLIQGWTIDLGLHQTAIDLTSEKYKALSQVAKQSAIEARLAILDQAIELEKQPTLLTKIFDGWFAGVQKVSGATVDHLVPNLRLATGVLSDAAEKSGLTDAITTKLSESTQNLSIDYMEIIRLESEKIKLQKELGETVIPKITKEVNKKGVVEKAVSKITKESGIQAGLSAQSSLGAVRSVIKAKLSEMLAGLLAREITSKGFFGVLTGAAVAGAANAMFEKNVPQFATGGDFVTNGRQMIMVGDNPSGREHVQVTPLGGDPAPNAPSGGSNITLNISAPLVDDTVVDTIIPAINEAIRRGETLATS